MKLLISFTAILCLFIFTNCTGKKTEDEATSALQQISAAPYSIDSGSYEIQNYKLNTSDGPIYFQVIPGCTDSCPVVVTSMPYNGISWSLDANDTRWTTQFPSGAFTDDVDGPNYVSGSGDQIAFFNSSIGDTAGFGGVFAPSKINVVLVYNRFYLGGKLDRYVDDFVSVVNSLSQFSYIDTSKMAFLGASLGGYVSMHASRRTNVKPVAIAGITPLLDLQSEQTEMSTTSSRITSNPTLLDSTQKFFNPYLRRMAGVSVNQYTSALLSADNSVSDILVIHDTWDTIVSINQYNTFKTQRPVDSYIFQHATAIDYNNFTMGHSQTAEGYSNDKVLPVFMSYILNRLKTSTEEKIIYYQSPAFLTGVSEIKMAHGRSQNISWFKNFIEDLCTDNFVLKDYSPTSNLGTLTGKEMAGGIIANVWNEPTTVANGCTYLQSHPNIFN